MRDQEIIGLWEAYQQVYIQPEEVEEVDEAMSSYDRNRKRAAQRAAERNAARDRGQTGAVPGVGYVTPRRESETYRDSAGVERHKTGARMPKKEDQNESFDLFDVILEHLVAEGYADTNEAALAIMANMSEEWRESIVEEVLDEAITSEKGTAKMKAMLDARTTASGRAKSGKGENVAQIKHIGRSEREGLRGTPMTPTMAKNPAKSRTFSGTGNKAARRAGTYKED